MRAKAFNVMKWSKPEAQAFPRLSEAGAQHPACVACGAGSTYSLPITSNGGAVGVVVVRGEQPTPATDHLMRKLWRRAGWLDQDVAVVDAVRCWPKTDEPTMHHIRCCRPWLLRALHLLDPLYILGLGNTAVRALLNEGTTTVTAHRGRRLVIPELERPVCYVSYHPSSVLDGMIHLKRDISGDFRRLSDPPLPWPVEETPTGPTIGVDTEYAADGRLLTVGLADEHHAIAIESEGGDWSAIQGVLLGATTLVGHSVAGDLTMLHQRGIIPASKAEGWLRGNKILDSLMLARMDEENGLSYSLEDALAGYVNLTPWKYKTAELLEKYKDMALVPQSLRVERCRLDAWAAWNLAQRAYRRVV